MREQERLIRDYYAAHGITHGAPLLFSYVRKELGGENAVIEYWAAKFGHVRGGKGKDVVAKHVMTFDPDKFRYSMSDSVVRYHSWSTLAMEHLIFDFHREIAGSRDYSKVLQDERVGGSRMNRLGKWTHEVMPTSEIPLNGFDGTKYQYCKYRYKDVRTCEDVVHSYGYWAKNPYGSLPEYLRLFNVNPQAMEMFASRGLVRYMKESFLVRLRDDRPFARWYRKHALETLGKPICEIENRARREIGRTCFEICRNEERRLKRLSDERRRVRRLRKQEREETARRIEAEKREKRERKTRAMRILNLYRKLKSICRKYGAYEIVVPKSEAEMRREGKRMHNCVGHCYPMRQGVDAIVVFVMKNGKKCVDIEVDPKTFDVVQCYRSCNREASKAEWRFAKEVAGSIMAIYRQAA